MCWIGVLLRGIISAVGLGVFAFDFRSFCQNLSNVCWIQHTDLNWIFFLVSGSGIVATVFGATGFLGRYLVQQLG